MSNTYSAGIATAYGAAVRGGYTGTYDEWCALMADYATVGQQAAQSAQAAQTSADNAAASESNAATSAGEAATQATAAAESAANAAQSATDAAGSASAASTSATNAAASATAAAGSASDAATSATNAAASEAAARAVEESIPEDYSELSADVSDLKSAFNDTVDPIADAITQEMTSRNLIDPSKLIEGRIGSNGNIASSGLTTYKTSDYIWLTAGTYLFAREKLSDGAGYAMGYSGYCLYNSSKSLIDNTYVWDNNSASGLTITITDPCYIRLSGAKEYFADDTTARFILQKGTTLTEWEAYFAPYRVVEVPQEYIEGGDNIGAIAEVTSTQSLINLYDKSLAVNGKYINSGSEVTLADWAWTGKIPVKPNTQYNISRNPNAPLELKTSVQQWGASGNFINSITPNGAYSYLVPFVTGPTTYFVSVNMSKVSHTTQDFNDTIDTIMLCYGTQRPLIYSVYNIEKVLLSEKLDNAYFNPKVFAGKKWLACGTSITWYDSKAYSAGLHTREICRGYVGNVARRKALLVTNEGISGSTLAGSGASALINRYQSLDWAGTDIATIEYGVNDFGNAIPIGTAEDAAGTDTFAACLKTIIEYALGQNPKLCLVICTEPDVRGNTANSGGHYLYEYTEVTLAIAKQYRLPVCDWYYHSGINAVTKGSSSLDYLTADGTHPNNAGHLRMGAMLNQVFDSLIC